MVITMYFKDYAPPHFHVRYGEQKALIDIQTGGIIEGELNKTALKLIKEWTNLHRSELLSNFEEAQKRDPQLQKIEPLQ